ncbi:MAG: glycosyltransferase [Candidatus Parvarchaeota archaeon]
MTEGANTFIVDGKFKVIFFTPTNMMTGAGVENVFAEYVVNKPEWVETKIIQGEWLPGSRLDVHLMEKIKEKAIIETFQIPVEEFDTVSRIFWIFRNLVFTLLVKIFYAPFHRREIADAIKGYDCIYLYGNWWAGLFPDGIAIVGTQHTDFGYRSDDLVTRIKVKLINSGLLYRKVTGFHLFPNSKQLKDRLKDGNNFLLPPRGVDKSVFISSARSGIPKFLFVGRLTRCKGILFILSLWNEYNFDAELHIVGTGELEEVVKKGSEKNKNIKFLGKLDRQELSNMYSASDVLLNPTSCDTYPTVVIEALMSGCHILASDLPSGIFDDFAKKGYLKYLSLDRVAWAEEISAIIKKIPSFRESNSEIRKMAEHTYDSKTISEKFYENLYIISKKCVKGEIKS